MATVLTTSVGSVGNLEAETDWHQVTSKAQGRMRGHLALDSWCLLKPREVLVWLSKELPVCSVFMLLDFKGSA